MTIFNASCDENSISIKHDDISVLNGVLFILTILWFIRKSTLTKKKLATLDGEIVDPEITIKLKYGMYLKYMMYKPNNYIIGYIKCNSICDKIEVMK